MSVPQTLSTPSVRTSPRIGLIRKKAFSRIYEGDSSGAVRIIVDVYRKTDFSRREQVVQTELLRSIWEKIEEKHLELYVESSNAAVAFAQAATVEEWVHDMDNFGQSSLVFVEEDFKEIYNAVIAFGKCSSIVTLMCEGILDITETLLVKIAETLEQNGWP